MSAKPVIKTSELSPELSERALRIAVDATEIESTEQVSSFKLLLGLRGLFSAESNKSVLQFICAGNGSIY